MFKNSKKLAKAHLISNYKYYFTTTLLFLTLNSLSYLLLNVGTNIVFWINFNVFLKIFILGILILVEFVFIPLCLIGIIKSNFLLSDTQEKSAVFNPKDKLSFNSIWNIILINFVPRFINLVTKIGAIDFSCLNIVKPNSIILCLMSLISVFLNYKWFAANFFFVKCRYSAITSIKSSINLMKRQFLKYIGLSLSFGLWYIIIAVLIFIIKIIIYGKSILLGNLYTPVFDAFSLFGVGISFYLFPYVKLTDLYFIEELRRQKGSNASGRSKETRGRF